MYLNTILFLGTFLIAYILIYILVGIPLVYLELAVGRSIKTSMISSWGHLCKYLRGTGVVSVIICYITSSYYVVIISWCFFYFINSFQYPLPWRKCPRYIFIIKFISTFSSLNLVSE